MSRKLQLTFACGDYEIMRALKEGIVQPEGIELTVPTDMAASPRHWRFLRGREFALMLFCAFFCLAFLLLPACFQKRAFLRVQGICICPGKFQCCRQTRATIKCPGISPQELPFLGRFGHLAVQAQSLPVCIQPFAQARPLAEQRLVGYLHGFLADGHQAAVGQRRQHVAPKQQRIVITGVERHPAKRQAAAGRGGAVSTCLRGPRALARVRGPYARHAALLVHLGQAHRGTDARAHDAEDI